MWSLILSLFGGSSLSAILGIGLIVSLIVGIGGTGWYRMKWQSCIAENAAAISEQHDIDKRDNAKAIAFLNKQLETNSVALNDATRRLNNVQKTTVCGPAPAIRATRDELCRLYPSSEACH